MAVAWVNVIPPLPLIVSTCTMLPGKWLHSDHFFGHIYIVLFSAHSLRLTVTDYDAGYLENSINFVCTLFLVF